jgi:hypothetical protein
LKIQRKVILTLLVVAVLITLPLVFSQKKGISSPYKQKSELAQTQNGDENTTPLPCH